MAIAKVTNLLRMNADVGKQAQFNQTNAQYGDLHKTINGLQGDARAQEFSKLAPHQRDALGALDEFKKPGGAPSSQGDLKLAFQNSTGQARGGYGKNQNNVTPKMGSAIDNFLNAAPSGKNNIDDVLASPVDRTRRDFVRTRSQQGGSYKGTISKADNISAADNVAGGASGAAGSVAAGNVAESGASAQSWMGKAWDKTVDAAKFSEGPAIPNFTFAKDRGVKGNATDNFNATKEWFGSGTTSDKWKKAGYTAGAYAGANLVGRGLTGGGATYNADGERDISGIPFV